ncbi:hypothetical protein [Myceligenerans crystallogenes]|uniref:PIN domain-containing protein n=1 Tax=Myceligenerans crystallogenes TaxID=316335 RepID=A0ABP4ZK33_9MICO
MSITTRGRVVAVLDSEMFSALLRDDRDAWAEYEGLHESGARIVVTANTIIEGTHPRTHPARLAWVLDQLQVEHVTKTSAVESVSLLRSAGMHGHSAAIDSTVAELALRDKEQATIYTSDPKDMHRLTDGAVRIVRR